MPGLACRVPGVAEVQDEEGVGPARRVFGPLHPGANTARRGLPVCTDHSQHIRPYAQLAVRQDMHDASRCSFLVNEGRRRGVDGFPPEARRIRT